MKSSWLDRINRFWRWVGTPFRAVISLTSGHIKSIFSIAMLGGIISLSMENWAIMRLAYVAVEQGDTFRPWFDLLLERTRYNSILQGFFAFILALIVFGADRFSAKIAGQEIEAGRELSK